MSSKNRVAKPTIIVELDYNEAIKKAKRKYRGDKFYVFKDESYIIDGLFISPFGYESGCPENLLIEKWKFNKDIRRWECHKVL